MNLVAAFPDINPELAPILPEQLPHSRRVLARIDLPIDDEEIEYVSEQAALRLIEGGIYL